MSGRSTVYVRWMDLGIDKTCSGKLSGRITHTYAHLSRDRHVVLFTDINLVDITPLVSDTMTLPVAVSWKR